MYSSYSFHGSQDDEGGSSQPLKMILQPNLMITVTNPIVPSIPATPEFFCNIHRTDELHLTNLGYFNPLKDVPINAPSNTNLIMTRFREGEEYLMTVLLIGNREIPDVLNFSATITRLEFVGHLSFTTSIFHIIAQLPYVTSVTVHVGKCQLPVFREIEPSDSTFSNEVVPWCPQVQELSVTMDLDCYYAPALDCNEECKYYCWDNIRFTFDTLLDSFFKKAKSAFPYLSNLYTVLPETDIYYGSVNSLIESCQYLKNGCYVVPVDGEDLINYMERPSCLNTSNTSEDGYAMPWLSDAGVLTSISTDGAQSLGSWVSQAQSQETSPMSPSPSK